MDYKEKNNEIIARLQSGDETAVRELLEFNDGLIMTFVNIYHNKYGVTDTTGLKQELSVNLYNAAMRFEIKKAVSFSTYATYYMKQVLKEVAKNCYPVSLPIQYMTEIFKKSREGDPTAKEYIRSLKNPIQIESVVIKSEDGDPEELLRQKELREHMQGLVKKLPAREQTIIVCTYGLFDSAEKNFAELSLQLGISAERVRQLHNAALRKLRRLAKERMR